MSMNNKQKRKSAKNLKKLKNPVVDKKKRMKHSSSTLRKMAQNFLDSRMRRPFFTRGAFSSVCDSILAEWSIWCYTSHDKVNSTFIQSLFPRNYTPRWSELFDSLAHQTVTKYTYEYDDEADSFYWTFEPIEDYWRTEYGFKLLPEDWSVVDEGISLSYRPPIDVYPVGLDIYYFGKYSFDTDEEKKLAEKFEGVRNDLAEAFAWSVVKYIRKEKPSAHDMTTKKIGCDKIEALYFESKCPKPDATWRQWVFTCDGYCLAFGSCLEEDVEKMVLPEIEKMIISFSMHSYTVGSINGGTNPLSASVQ